MNTFEEREKYLQDKLGEFSEKMKAVAGRVISDFEVEYLPYVMLDTECNVAYKTGDCIERILRGKFEVGENFIRVNGICINLTNHSDLATCIYNAAKDKVENSAIKELERIINNLENQIKTQRAYT